MKYFIIAGEASGDLHASNLLRALRKKDPQAQFVGLGGNKMQAQGCHLLQHYRNMAFMGVIAVLCNIGKVRNNFRIAREGLLQEVPDCLILIDYPSFNLKMAAFCRKHLPNTKIIYYIPPKIWAWKTWRVHRIAQLSDQILGIFPFEPAFYEKYGYRCTYVGNPTMDTIRYYLACNKEAPHAPAVHTDSLTDLPTDKYTISTPFVAILPGSRPSEIRHCLPTMLEAARNVLQRQQEPMSIVVAAAPGIDDAFYAPYLREGETLIRNTFDYVRQAQAAVVNSGTATLETALLDCPQTAVYYIACSKWLGWLRPFIFRIPYFTLVNIIPHREVIQELIAYRFSQRNIEIELTRLLQDESYRQQMRKGYNEIRKMLGTQPAADHAAEIIIHGTSDNNHTHI